MVVDRRRDYGEPPQVDGGSVVLPPGTDFSYLTSRNDKSGVVDEPAAGGRARRRAPGWAAREARGPGRGHGAAWHDHRMLRLTDFIIDCPDPLRLAAFYSAVTGRPVKDGSTGEWAGIAFGEVELAFIRVDGYRAPQWPDGDRSTRLVLIAQDLEPARIASILDSLLPPAP